MQARAPAAAHTHLSLETYTCHLAHLIKGLHGSPETLSTQCAVFKSSDNILATRECRSAFESVARSHEQLYSCMAEWLQPQALTPKHEISNLKY